MSVGEGAAAIEGYPAPKKKQINKANPSNIVERKVVNMIDFLS
jgi:hypothetical protein